MIILLIFQTVKDNSDLIKELNENVHSLKMENVCNFNIYTKKRKHIIDAFTFNS